MKIPQDKTSILIRLFGTIPQKVSGWFDAAEQESGKRMAQQLLEEEKKYTGSVKEPNEIAAAYRKYIEEERKLNRQGAFYKIFNVTKPYGLFKPMVSPTSQKLLEAWWFSLEPQRRESIMKKELGNDFRSRLTRATLMQKAQDKTSPKDCQNIEKIVSSAWSGIVHYWPIFALFAVLLVILMVNVFLQKTSVALVGFVCASLVLWQCRLIKAKQQLGLTYFCPFAIMFILRAFFKYGNSNVKSKQEPIIIGQN